MKTTIALEIPVVRTARVMQLEGLFDVPPSKKSAVNLEVDLPIGVGEGEAWQIGLIVGPSGSGKTTVAKTLWPEEMSQTYAWDFSKSILDSFPQDLGINEIVELINSVGFSSPPSWVRPYHVLSTGERFRVDVARAIAEALASARARQPERGPSPPHPKIVVLDEFTSVVDRTVAQVGSSAIGRTIRQLGSLRLVAVTCHNDVEEWLQPDWVYEPASGVFTRRSVQRRPPIELEIARVHHSAWALFRRHHYLDTGLNHAAICFVAYWNERPVCFSSWLSQPHGQIHNLKREHRTVVLPDFQGVGVGNSVSTYLASVWRTLGYRAMSTTSHPAMVRSRAKSPLWRMHRAPARTSGGGMMTRDQAMGRKIAIDRLTAGFEYVGPTRDRHAAKELVAG